jgi:hypothetical protein
MPNARTYKGIIWEDSGCQLLARIVGVDAAAIVQADVSSISYSVYERDEEDAPGSGSAVRENAALTVSSVVFNALQTDARWTVDSTGYNFRYAAPVTDFPNPSKVYDVEIKFTPASGDVYHVVFEVETKALSRS